MLGVVLAGGASKRMGRDKALVDLEGRPLIAWVTDALSQVCPRVLIAGRPWGEFEVIADEPGLVGPRAGLAAALGQGEDVLLVAVDQPWVRVETLASLASRARTSVPLAESVPQVTCALYGRQLKLSGNGSLQDLVKPGDLVAEEEWREWSEDGRSWFSVNRPTDLEAGLTRFGTPASR